MFVRTNFLTGEVSRAEQGVEHLRDVVAPALAEQPGNLGLLVLLDRGTGRSVVASYWTDQAAMRASQDAVASLRDNAARVIGAGDVRVESYEAVLVPRQPPPEPGRHVRLTHLAARPEDRAAVISFVESDVTPALERAAGFQGVLLLVAADGRGIAASAWNSRADLDASAGLAGELRSDTRDKTGASVTGVDSYEVVLNTLRPG
jgi:heme-degrading monooxygenase HmoA